MRLKEIRLGDFGKFHNKTINLENGINLIYGENEAGKSTIHSFIKGMLFGIEKPRGRASKEDAYEKYKPWDHSGSYNGSMDLESDGKNIRIIRSFDKNNKNCTVIDLETGRELDAAGGLAAFYGRLTESGYRNTISIEQLKAKTDQELAEEVRNYITNLSLAGSNEVDVKKALEFLQDKRKELEESHLDTRLKALEKELEEGLKKEMLADELALKLKEAEEQEKKLQKENDIFAELGLEGDFPDLASYQDYLDQFPVIKEKYRNYKEAKQQREVFREKQAFLRQNLSKYREDLTGLFRQKIDELDSIKYEIGKKEEEKNSYLKEQELLLDREKKRQVVFASLLSVSGLALLLYFTGKNGLLTGFGSAALLCGVVLYLWFDARLRIGRRNKNRMCGELDHGIAMLKENVRSVLSAFQAGDEKTLKLKYEEALKQEMTFEHLKKQGKDEMEQAERLDRKIAILEKEITDYFKRLAYRVPAGSLAGMIPDDIKFEEAERFILKQKESITENLGLLSKESEDIRIQKEKLKWELRSIEGWEDKLLEDQQLHEELIQQKKENDLELEAVRLSIETINSLSADIHDSFGKKLNELVSKLSAELTGQKYTDIKIDEKLNMKIGYKDNYVLLNKLSAGTIEQLYLSLRLGVSDLVYGQGIMPILLDDCFALYDDKRTGAALLYLSEQRKSQVLLFTCHNREKAILDRLNINYHYIDLSESQFNLKVKSPAS